MAAQKAWYVVTHPTGVNLASAIVGVSALAAIFLLNRTRIALFASLVAVVIPTVMVAVLGLDDIETVADVGAIPSGLPPLVVPHLSDLTVGVITGAFAIAAIALVQGAGVAEAAPNAGRAVGASTATSSGRASRTWPPASSTAPPSAGRSAAPR